MFFLPYRLDVSSGQIPFLTILICIACSFIYWQQYSVDRQYYEAVENFCLSDLSKREIGWLKRVHGDSPGYACVVVLESIRGSDDPKAEIERLAGIARPINLFTDKQENRRYIEQRVAEIFYKFDRDVPRHLTSELAYYPGELNLLKMVTATFSHASWDHLLGNLLFFYIFAASIEIVFGVWVFSLFIALSTLVTSLAYSYAMSGVENALPTVGLSGVVMAAVAALAVMMPEVRIRCFFWFLVIFRIFRIPALFLAVWYIGWDIFSYSVVGDNSPINYVAHISGAAAGAMIGLYYRVFRQTQLDEMRV